MRRSPEQRRRDRLAGVDLKGRPLPRSIGASPRQLMRLDPELTIAAARTIGAELVRDRHVQELRRRRWEKLAA